MRARALPAAAAFAVAVSLLLSTGPAAFAQVTPTLQPGDTLRFVGADFDYRFSGDCDDAVADCVASVDDLGVEAVRTYVAAALVVGVASKQVGVTSRLIGSFTIGGDNGHRIGAKLDGLVRWRGWLLAGAGAWEHNSTVDIAVAIYDVTTATTPADVYRQLVGRQTVYSNSISGKLSATPEFERGIGSGSYNLAVDLYRGHTYFAVLEVTCASSSGLAGISSMASFSQESFAASPLDDGFVERTRMILRTELDWLELIEDLRDEFQGHRHEYRTGRGEGHNNTGAETSSPLDSAASSLAGLLRPGDLVLGPATEVREASPQDLLPGGSEAFEFALPGAQPNPSADGLVVRFSLPDASAAVLELFDVSGRRVLSRGVGSLGPGAHTLRLAERGALPAGVYLLRLTRGGQSLSSRLSVMR